MGGEGGEGVGGCWMSVCEFASVCMYVRERESVCVCVCARAHASVCVCVCVCVFDLIKNYVVSAHNTSAQELPISVYQSVSVQLLTVLHLRCLHVYRRLLSMGSCASSR